MPRGLDGGLWGELGVDLVVASGVADGVLMSEQPVSPSADTKQGKVTRRRSRISLASLFASAAESAATSLTLSKFFDDIEGDLQHRDDHQLS